MRGFRHIFSDNFSSQKIGMNEIHHMWCFKRSSPISHVLACEVTALRLGLWLPQGQSQWHLKHQSSDWFVFDFLTHSSGRPHVSPVEHVAKSKKGLRP